MLDVDNGKTKGLVAAESTPLRSSLSLLSDSYLAFLWWTTLTALHPTSEW
jgi:hypothetical protein